MTLAGSSTTRRVRTTHPGGMRLAAWLLVGLAVLIVASGFLAENRAFGFLAAVFVAANIVHKAGWSLWAIRSGRIAGTKVLAMIAAVIALAWIIMAYFIEGVGPYFYAAVVLGLLAAGVAVWDAVISPDEDRRMAFEPRTVDDVPAHEMAEHGHEHRDGR